MFKRVFVLCMAAMLFAVSASPSFAKGLDYGMDETFVNIHGLISMEYYDFDKKGKNAGVSSFDQMLTYLLFDTKIEKNLSGIVELKLDRGGEKIKLDRCFLDYDFAEHWSIRAGKFYLPFHFEVKEFRPTGNKLISNPMPEVMDFDMFRELGMQLSAHGTVLGMPMIAEGAVVNGLFRAKFDAPTQTSIDSTIDTNNDKALCGRLTVKPVQEVTLTGSYMSGLSHMYIYNETYSTTLSPIPQEMSTATEWVIDLGNLDTRMHTFTAIAELNRLTLKSWYTSGTFHSTKANMSTSQFTGCMGEVAYQILKDKIVPSFEVVFRRKHFNIDSRRISIATGKDEDWDLDSFGICTKLREHLTFKAEYLTLHEIKPSTDHDNGTMFQLMIDF